MINLTRDLRYSPNPKVISEMGISYRLSVLQTIVDQMWYFDCRNVPEVLPDGVTVLEGDLEEFIGYGLSHKQVEFLRGQAEIK